MPLNLNADGGDFTPYLKFNAKAGRFYARFDGFDGDVEVPPPRLVFDFPNIQTGWIAFSPSGPPQCAWDPSLALEAPHPGWDKVRRGFKVRVVGNDPVPSANKKSLGLREMMSSASAIIKPIMAMYTEWEGAVAQHTDELPFYRCTGVIAIQGQHGTNYEPEFELTGWVPKSKLEVLNGVQAEPGQQAGESTVNYSEPPSSEPYIDDDIPF